MKFRQVQLARSIRQVATIGTGAPRADLVQRLKQTYRFMKAPEQFQEMFPTPLQVQAGQGLTFQEGRFVVGNREIGINLFQISAGVLFADTRSSTDDADLFLEDYVTAANKMLPGAVTSNGPSYYVSQVEFEMERIPAVAPEYASAAGEIDRLLSGYGLQVPKYQFLGLHLSLDPLGVGVINPAPFTLERRMGFAFKSNIYFSQAPLRTKEHLALLEKLDSVLN